VDKSLGKEEVRAVLELLLRFDGADSPLHKLHGPGFVRRIWLRKVRASLRDVMARNALNFTVGLYYRLGGSDCFGAAYLDVERFVQDGFCRLLDKAIDLNMPVFRRAMTGLRLLPGENK
jgi:hypothetical protein